MRIRKIASTQNNPAPEQDIASTQNNPAPEHDTQVFFRTPVQALTRSTRKLLMGKLFTSHLHNTLAVPLIQYCFLYLVCDLPCSAHATPIIHDSPAADDGTS